MSDLFRSAISSRIARLPPDVPIHGEEDEEDEEAEAADSISILPASGMGPPAMQVANSFDFPQDNYLNVK